MAWIHHAYEDGRDSNIEYMAHYTCPVLVCYGHAFTYDFSFDRGAERWLLDNGITDEKVVIENPLPRSYINGYRNYVYFTRYPVGDGVEEIIGVPVEAFVDFYITATSNKLFSSEVLRFKWPVLKKMFDARELPIDRLYKKTGHGRNLRLVRTYKW